MARKKDKIEELRLKVKDSALKDIRTDDIYLYRFLHCCDWNVESAYNRITRVTQHRKTNSEWFVMTPDVDEYNRLLKKNIKFMLDKRDKNGRRIYVTKMANVNVSDTTVYDQAQLDDLWFSHVLEEKDTIENGVTAIIDMKGYTWKMLNG